MIGKTLGELARLVDGKVVGDPSMLITGVAGVREAGQGDITFAANQRYAGRLKDSKASAAVVVPGLVVGNGMPLIQAENPDEAFTKIADVFAPPAVKYEPGVDPTAFIAEDVKLEKDVSIGAHVVIEAGATIGARTVLRPQTYVGHAVTIGEDCLIYPNVTIRERVTIGSRCIIHSGTVIGSDGFGYVTRGGRHEKIPQVGTVVIEDDVEIGACVTIDRARFDRTWIRRGTKIDNLVQIAHNVVIGENSLIVSMVGIAGSVHMGKNVILAGKSSVDGHVVLGDNVVVGGLAGVTKDVPDGTRVSGFPAQPHDQQLKLAASLRRVPELLQRIKELESKVRELEHAPDDDQ